MQTSEIDFYPIFVDTFSLGSSSLFPNLRIFYGCTQAYVPGAVVGY